MTGRPPQDSNLDSLLGRAERLRHQHERLRRQFLALKAYFDENQRQPCIFVRDESKSLKFRTLP